MLPSVAGGALSEPVVADDAQSALVNAKTLNGGGFLITMNLYLCSY